VPVLYGLFLFASSRLEQTDVGSFAVSGGKDGTSVYGDDDVEIKYVFILMPSVFFFEPRSISPYSRVLFPEIQRAPGSNPGWRAHGSCC
jgi:hypothetical protein